MKKRRQMLGLIAACALAFTGSFAGYADPVAYDVTADASHGGKTFSFDAEQPKLFPGDSIFGAVSVFLGADKAASGEAAGLKTDDTGTPYWTNSSAAVYTVTDVTPAAEPQTEMVPLTDDAGNPVLNEDGSQAMVAQPAAGAAVSQPAYQLDAAGYVVEVTGGKSSGEGGEEDPSAAALKMTADDGSESEVVPDAQYYPEGTKVTLTADQAPDGQTFAGWTVSRIGDDGSVSKVDDISSLSIPEITADSLKSDHLTFTVAPMEHVLVFSANFAAAQTEAPQTEVPAPQSEAPQTEVPAPQSEAPQTEAPAPQSEAPQTETPAPQSEVLQSETAIEPNANTADDSQNKDPQTPADITINPDQTAVMVSVTFVSGDGQDSTIVTPYEDGFSKNISTAPQNPAGQIFDHWESSDVSAVFADPASASTTITFQAAPTAAVNVTAVYTDTAKGDVPAADANAETPSTDGAQNPADSAEPAPSTDGTQTPSSDANAQTPATDGTQNPADGQNTQPAQTEVPQTDAPQTEVPQTEVPLVVTHAMTVSNTDGSVTVTDASGAPVADLSKVAEGAEIHVKATVPAGFVFKGWTIGPEGTALDGFDTAKTENTFKMPKSDITLTAHYEAAVYSITAAPGSGKADGYTTCTIAATDKNGQAVSDLTKVPEGASVQVTLSNTTAKESLTGTYKKADGTDTAVSITDNGNGTFAFTMPAGNVSLIYSAAEGNTYYANITVANGVISSDGNKNAGSYIAGTALTIKAGAAPAGKVFNGWSLQGSGAAIGDASKQETTLTVDSPLSASASLTVTANYKDITYNLTVKSGSGSGQYTSASPATITANPAQAGYKFSGWSLVSGSGTFANQGAATTTFTCGSDAVVQANYEPIAYKITVKNGDSSGSYNAGEKIDLAADFPEPGKEFDKWSVTSGKLDVADKTKYNTTATVRASDATVTALYKNGPSPDSNTITGLEDGMEYLKSSTLTFTAVGAGMDHSNPNPGDYRYRPTGYQIGSVTGSWSNAPYTTSMAINSVGDYTLTVTYARDVYDGKNWSADGTTDSKSITFHVVNALSVQTGDSSPIIPLVVTAVIALAAIIVILVVARKHKKQ